MAVSGMSIRGRVLTVGILVIGIGIGALGAFTIGIVAIGSLVVGLLAGGLVVAKRAGSQNAPAEAVNGQVSISARAIALDGAERQAQANHDASPAIPRGGSKRTVGSPGRRVFAAVGIDCYQQWPSLSNAVRDAKGAIDAFGRFGFKQITAPLLDSAATGDAMRRLVTDDLSVLGPDDSLVVFFSGHGTTRTHFLGGQQIKSGLLVPSDANRSNMISSLIDLDDWLHAISRLPAKHILVILDACNAGVALSSVTRWRDAGGVRDRSLSALSARRSRRVITSALDDQLALDNGPLPGHSLFTGCLIEALTGGLASSKHESITGSELGLYVQNRVRTYPNSSQTPDFGTFDFDDRGELVISLADDRLDPAVVAAPLRTANSSGWLDLLDLEEPRVPQHSLRPMQSVVTSVECKPPNQPAEHSTSTDLIVSDRSEDHGYCGSGEQIVRLEESDHQPNAFGPKIDVPGTVSDAKIELLLPVRSRSISYRGKIDFGVLTIREDENAAVLRRFDKLDIADHRRRYRIRHLPLPTGEAYTLAVLRTLEHGTTDAQAATHALLEDLAPRFVLVVGIAGGIPSYEFSLGDVVVSSRIADFSVEAVIRDKGTEYALAGGPLHPDAAKLAADISASITDGELEGWNSETALKQKRPLIDLSIDRFYGNDDWKKFAYSRLNKHFSNKSLRGPFAMTGAIASSDRLIKDDEKLAVWLKIARQVVAVEMESAGIYKATQERGVPFLAVRGISDIVGFERDPDWTTYACQAAATFARSFLCTRPIEPIASGSHR